MWQKKMVIEKIIRWGKKNLKQENWKKKRSDLKQVKTNGRCDDKKALTMDLEVSPALIFGAVWKP